MLGLIPLPWKLGILAFLAALLSVTCYVGGRKSKQVELDTLRQSYQVAAAQSAAREAERVRMWTGAVIQAGRQYDERAKVADASFDSNIDRLRNAYSTSARLRPPASAAGSCPEPSGPTAGELLKAGELVAGMVRDADRDRAALEACVAAWPR